MIKNKDKELDLVKINDSVNLLNKILRVAFILLLVVGLYLFIKVCQTLQIKHIVLTGLKTIAPVFIGLFLAWLFDPIVSKLQKKGLRRSLGAIIVYIAFIAFLVILISSIIPILTDQINDFVNTLPSIFNSIKDWIMNIFDNINIEGFDIKNYEVDILSKIQDWGTDLAASLPNLTVNFLRSFFAGFISFIVGLIIGFYFLIGFDNASEMLLTLLPKKMRKDAISVGNDVNATFRHFIVGAILDSTFVFIITSIAFLLVGLKAPLLFGLFCGITNVIPYAGPYIGGAPAVIVGFSQGPIVGIFTLLSVVIIQFLEGNFIQPVIMSKTTKLHPVTIITGLLLFGHFFGIIGMAISTPIIGAVKAILMYFNNKYHFINL